MKLEKLMHRDQNNSEQTDNLQTCEFPINTPWGEVNIDLLSFEKAKKKADEIANPPGPNEMGKLVQEYLGGQEHVDTVYWGPETWWPYQILYK